MNNAHRIGATSSPRRNLRSLLKRAAPACLMLLVLAIVTGATLAAFAWLDHAFGLTTPAVMRLGTP